MRLAVLFSGGKDSTYALHKALRREEVACLITIISKNKESYMFHTPNIDLTELQAKAIGLPLIKKETRGEKEEELRDLKEAIIRAKEEFSVEGIVTGAVESIYQATRIQRICDELGLWCFNPLWKKDQEELLRETLSHGFKTIISGVFAYPLNKEWLGREVDKDLINELVELEKKFSISPAGEGGEIETSVLDAPFFKKKIRILEYEIVAEEHSGLFLIRKAELVDK